MKKTRPLLIASLLALSTLAARSESITVATARQIALHKVASRAKKAAHATDADKLQLAHMAHSNDGLNVDYYVFNHDDQGYVIVSGDDRVVPVLGYSDEGHFDVDSLPDNARWWLQQLQGEMDYVRSQPDTQPLQATVLDGCVPPLLASVWDQGSPYNDFCPMWGNYRCMTGCLATAMAQIMYYYHWPKQGQGNMTYTTTIYNTETELSCDFSQSVYDWEHMTDFYTDISDSLSRQAVARLMSDAGIAVKMGYSPSSSGAYVGDALLALHNHFGYSKGASMLVRNITPVAEWEQMMRNELDAHRPVLYSGCTATGGHAFVLDGYDRDGLFHINWGWSGRSNGYFALTALNPSSQGAGSYTGGYNSEQMAIVGICPSDAAAPVDTVYGYYFAMTPTQETASPGDIVELNLNNYGIVAFGHDVEHTRLGISVEDESGRIVWTTVDECAATAYFSGVTYKNRQLTLSLPQSLADGRYRLRPVFAVGDLEARHFIPAISQPDGVVMAVDGGIIRFQSDPISEELTLLSLATDCDEFYTQRPIPVTAVISNAGEEYHGNLSLELCQEDSVLIHNDLKVCIPHNEQQAVHTVITAPNKAGQYSLRILNSQGAMMGSELVLNVIKAGTQLLSIAEPLTAAADTMPAENVQATATISNAGGPFMGWVEMLVMDSTATATLATIQSEFLVIKKNEPHIVTFTGAFAGKPGTTYRLALRNPSVTTSFRVWGDDVSFVVACPEEIVGDITHDGQIDVADVNTVINIILGKLDMTAAADVDKNGVVDVGDVNYIINLILGK